MTFALFAGAGFYLMRGFTLFVLLHVVAALGCGVWWVWAQWRLRRGNYPSLAGLIWPRRLLWLSMVIAVLVLLSVSGKKLWLDLTPGRALSLSAASQTALGSLSQPVEALVALPGRRGSEALALLQRYQRATDFFSVRQFGGEGSSGREPALPGEGVLLRVGERQEFLATVSEETVTNALLRLSTERKKIVYVVGGHGEPSLEDTGPAGFAGLKRVLEKERCAVRRLLLVSTPIVPADADLLIVPSGVNAPLPEEKAAVASMLRAGGMIAFLLAPDHASVWADLLAEFGIVWDRQWVEQRLAVRVVKDHPLAQALPRNSAAVFAGFFPLRVWGHLPDGAEVRPALVSDEAEKLSPALIAARAPGQGFLTLAVTAEYPVPGKQEKTRVAVFGGQGFVTNVGLSQLANQDVLVGSVRWLTQGEGEMRIPPRGRMPAQMIIAPESLEATFVLLVLLPPELFLLAGVIGLGVKGRL